MYRDYQIDLMIPLFPKEISVIAGKHLPKLQLVATSDTLWLMHLGDMLMRFYGRQPKSLSIVFQYINTLHLHSKEGSENLQVR